MTEREIFEAVQEKPPAERQPLLDALCGTDQPLRQRIEALLTAHQQAESFLSQAAIEERATVPPRPGQLPFDREAVGSLIGPYKLLQKLGEGGMGIVWVAEQEHPIKRRVALKLVKAGMDSAQVIRRFEAERQALAMMDHTNIAKVLDVGTTSNGRPYFVMELVKGVPITRYCDEVHASIEARLELFVQVCAAVQHAHQKGIIHRDIKPSNILIAMQDGKPVPKVIDFGVAKALHTRLADKTMYTEIGQVIGTLEYMAPEQAELSAMDIDTRADIYALGVVLYELLTGSTPITHERMKSAAIFEVLRIIKEEEPPKPSTRLTDSKESLASLAALRKTDPKRLSNVLKGELDWVVLKALEKDRTCRYETANGLARDIQRYLADEVVEARPPSTSYRYKKFLKRHKGQVAAVLAILVTLLAGLLGTGWGLFKAQESAEAERQAKMEALSKQADAEQARKAEARQRKQAEEKSAETEAVLQFVERKILSAGRPIGQENGLGKSALLKDALTASLPYISDAFAQQPVMEARLRKTLGISFALLGDAPAAEEQFRHTLRLNTAVHGPHHLDTLRAMNNLANSISAQGRDADALTMRKETLELRRIHLGPDHSDTQASRNNLAASYFDTGKYQEAITLYQETLKHGPKSLGNPDHPYILNAMSDLALCYSILDRHQEALVLREKVLEKRMARHGLDHQDTLTSLQFLGDSQRALGRLPQALENHQKALEHRLIVLGKDHPDTLTSQRALATTLEKLNRTPEAVALRQQAYATAKSKLGSTHPDTLVSAYVVIKDVAAEGRPEEAAGQFKELLPLMQKHLGATHPHTLSTLFELAKLLRQTGQPAESLRLHEQALKLRREQLGVAHIDTQASLKAVAESYLADNRFPESEVLLMQCHEGEKLRATINPIATVKPSNLPDLFIQLYTWWNKPDEVKKWQTEKAKLPPPSPAKP